MFLTEFDEGLRLRYYIPKINNRGWGVVYATFQVGDRKLRLSTRVKVKAEYWNKGVVIYPSKGLLSDKLLHRIAEKKLYEITENIDKVFFDYLNNETSINELNLIEDIRNKITPMAKKNKQPQSVICMLKFAVEETPNEKTKKQKISYINKFSDFLKVKNLKDEVKVINQNNMNLFRDWLTTSVQTSTAKNIFDNFFTILRHTEIKHNMSFDVDKKKIIKIKDPRTQEEKKDNYVALTSEDLQKLSSVEVTNSERVVRDLFLLTCYTSVRYEDILDVLDAKHYKVLDGITYCIFKSEKTKITYHIPLNDPNLYPKTIELIEKYANLSKMPTNFDGRLKKIAKKANLDTLYIHSNAVGTKVVKEEKIMYDGISCHWGRHTLITNLHRYFGMQAKDIKYISGHADEKIIESTYINTTTEDNVNLITKALKRNNQVTNPNNACNTSDVNRGINGIEEGLNVLKFLGVDVTEENLTFEEIVEMIMKREGVLLNDYGVKVSTLKDLFNYVLPISKRIARLREILKVFEAY